MFLGVTLIIFTITHVIPADPARVAAGLNAPEEQVERLREEMGLNEPIIYQYIKYMNNILHGDLGKSMLSRTPVIDQLKIFLPATLELIILAGILFLFTGTFFGIFAGVSNNRWGVFGSRIVAFTGMAIPVFWLALMIQIFVSQNFSGFFPLGGRLPIGYPIPYNVTGFYTVDSILAGDWKTFLISLRHLILPAFTIALGRFGATARFVASEMKEVMHQDYIKTARAKGISEKKVIFKHALKNAMIPVVTMSGLQFGWMLGSTVLVESIFSWPGIGLYAWRSVVSLDFLPIMGVTLVLSVSFVTINVIVDILYGILDPRISL